MARLLARVKPSLTWFRISRTCGQSRRTSSDSPSAEPLSTTVTWKLRPGGFAKRLRRHSAISSRVFQVTTTASSSGAWLAPVNVFLLAQDGQLEGPGPAAAGRDDIDVGRQRPPDRDVGDRGAVGRPHRPQRR